MKPRRGITPIVIATLAAAIVANAGWLPNVSAQTQAPRADAPSGQMTWAVHFSLAPTFFDPAETPGLITPFLVLYALHDALVICSLWRTSR